MSNIFLVGFMGAGKTTVGKHLARHLGWQFIDLDALIVEQTGKMIVDIFAQEGEAYFRQLETKALASLALNTNTIIALGGGTFVKAINRSLIEQQGVSIWLDCPLDEILARLANDSQRPLYQNPTQLAALLQERLPNYHQAQHRLVVAGLSIEMIVTKIVELVKPLI